MNRSTRKRGRQTSEKPNTSSSSGCGVYGELMDEESDPLPVKKEPTLPPTPPPPKPKLKPKPTIADHVSYPKLGDVDPVCRLCLVFGHREIYVTAQGQRAHVVQHLNQSIDFLRLEQSTIPDIDDRLLTKCFPFKISVREQPPPNLPKPTLKILTQKIPIVPIISDFKGKEEESMPKLDQIGGTAKIGKCKPLFFEKAKVKVKEEVEESWEDDDQEEEDRIDQSPTWSARAESKVDQNRRIKEQAVEKLVTIYNNPLQRTNFELVAGGIWPMFIANGYRYRLSRVYRNGKCELRCASDGVCKGKAIIRPDEPYPYYLQAIDNHSHEPMANNKLLGALGKKYVAAKKLGRK